MAALRVARPGCAPRRAMLLPCAQSSFMGACRCRPAFLRNCLQALRAPEPLAPDNCPAGAQGKVRRIKWQRWQEAVCADRRGRPGKDEINAMTTANANQQDHVVIF